MSDVFTKRKRSEVMSRIRGRGNKETELALAKLLRAYGIAGWRRQQSIRLRATMRRARRSRPTNIRTDFVFRRERVAVFVDGCFWHGCPKHANMPASNRAFWKKKLTGNKFRDGFVTRQLRREGWRVIRIWEHELGQGSGQESEVRRQKVVERIRRALR